MIRFKLPDTQQCVDHLLERPLADLVDAQKGAERTRHTSEGWSELDQYFADLVETILSFRLDQGLTQ